MKTKDWFLMIVEVVLWYFVIYYTLYAIKNPTNLFISALILLIASYLAMLACPWLRHSEAWKRMWGKKE